MVSALAAGVVVGAVIANLLPGAKTGRLSHVQRLKPACFCVDRQYRCHRSGPWSGAGSLPGNAAVIPMADPLATDLHAWAQAGTYDWLGGLCNASNHVTSRPLVHLKLQLTARLSLFEQLVERCKSVEGLIEAWLAPFQRLLNHRSPELCRIAFLRIERVDRLAHEIYGLLPPILRCLRRLAV